MKILKSLLLNKIFLYLVVLPFLVAILYYSFLAKDRFVSYSQVVVRQSGEDRAQQASGVAMLLSGINPSSREETLYLREFVSSVDMLMLLDKELNWRHHYNKQFRDPIFWLSENAPVEDILKFYRRIVKPNFDETTGLLNIEVQGYDAEFSNKVLSIILRESENLVNDLSQQMARDQIAFADRELSAARFRLNARQEELLRFQSDNNLLDAQATAASRNEIVAQLEGELVRERASLTGLLTTLSRESTQVRQKLARIHALEKQLQNESEKLVSSADGDRLSVVVSKFRDLTLASDFALESYKLALMSVERTRVNSQKNIKSLVTVVSPNTAESAIYPTRAYNLLTILIALLLGYGIVIFVLASIRDHRD